MSDDHDDHDTDSRRRERHILAFAAGLILLSAVAVLGLWLGKRIARGREAHALSTEADRGPLLRVATVGSAPAARDVTLTADVRAYFQTSLYAKIAGYVRDLRVDKGDRVKRNQVLGTIESPETDQAFLGARSQHILAWELAKRARRLAPDVVAVQDLETANSSLTVARSNLGVAATLQGYEIIRAPFDGVITARYVDPGALLPAATGSTQSALPLVDIADTGTLRIQVFPGQDVAPFVRVGDKALVWEDDRPAFKITATVTRTSASLDPRTRTMLVEVQLDNRTAGLLPGTFAHVTLHVQASPAPTVPAEALFVRGGRSFVARIEGGRAHFAEVAPGISDGRTMQILTGVREGEVVGLNVPTEVTDGAAVQEAKPH